MFDSAILYEGEHALLWLIEALNGERAIASVPNLIYRDASGIHRNSEVYTEKTTPALPLPDFDGVPLDCVLRAGADHSLPGDAWLLIAVAARFSTMARATSISIGVCRCNKFVEQIKALRDKYQCRHFLFSDESYPRRC